MVHLVQHVQNQYATCGFRRVMAFLGRRHYEHEIVVEHVARLPRARAGAGRHFR